MKKTTHIMITVVLAIIAAWGCASLDPLAPDPVGTGSVSFARFHVIGDGGVVPETPVWPFPSTHCSPKLNRKKRRINPCRIKPHPRIPSNNRYGRDGVRLVNTDLGENGASVMPQ